MSHHPFSPPPEDKDTPTLSLAIFFAKTGPKVLELSATLVLVVASEALENILQAALSSFFIPFPLVFLLLEYTLDGPKEAMKLYLRGTLPPADEEVSPEIPRNQIVPFFRRKRG